MGWHRVQIDWLTCEENRSKMWWGNRVKIGGGIRVKPYLAWSKCGENMKLRGTNRASRAKPVSNYLRIIYFIFDEKSSKFSQTREGRFRASRPVCAAFSQR